MFSPPPDPSPGDNNRGALTEAENRLLTERERQVKNQANRWFLALLVVGLTLGGATAWGLIKVLGDLGLTQPPQPRLSQPQN